MKQKSDDPAAVPAEEPWRWKDIKLLFTTSPRELYLIYAMKLLESFNYFTFTLLYPFYLTDELGVDDKQTGLSLGILGTISLVYGIILSPLIDFVGIKPCLMLSFLMSAGTRLGLAFAPSQGWFFGLVYGPMSVAFSLGMPVLMIGIKKYTPQRNWGMAYSLYYSMMNVAALFSGACLDIFTIRLKAGVDGGLLALSSGHRMLMALASVTSVLAALVVLCLREPRVVQQEQVNLLGYSDLEDTEDQGCTTLMSCRDRAAQLGEHVRGIVGDREFWKFMAVCCITINMRTLFRHLDFTMPKYIKRAFGCNAPAGSFYSINPFTIILAVPVIGILTNHIPHFDIIHMGSYIHATSAFWLAGFQSLWAVALFVVQLSLGEAIWSPRWYDYSMSVAPNGKEGIFVALAAAPLFFAKLPTGIVSGQLLQELCPETIPCSNTTRSRQPPPLPPPLPLGVLPPPTPPLPACRGRTMWLIIGCISVTSPLMLLLFYRWLKPAPRTPQRSPSSLLAAAADGEHKDGMDPYHPDKQAAAATRPSKATVGHDWTTGMPVALAQLVDPDAEGLHPPTPPSRGYKSPTRGGARQQDKAPLLPRAQPKSD